MAEALWMFGGLGQRCAAADWEEASPLLDTSHSFVLVLLLKLHLKFTYDSILYINFT